MRFIFDIAYVIACITVFLTLAFGRPKFFAALMASILGVLLVFSTGTVQSNPDSIGTLTFGLVVSSLFVLYVLYVTRNVPSKPAHWGTQGVVMRQVNSKGSIQIVGGLPAEGYTVQYDGIIFQVVDGKVEAQGSLEGENLPVMTIDGVKFEVKNGVIIYH